MTAPSPTILESSCTGCGLCVRACPSGILALQNGTARATAPECIGCGHCQALCPAQAVAMDQEWSHPFRFQTFHHDDEELLPGKIDLSALARLVRSRRSCRLFTGQPVAPEILRDLVLFGWAAPSGTNAQGLVFTVLPDRATVIRLGEGVADFFQRLNSKAANPFLRKVLALVGRPELEHYYQRHFQSAARALRQWDEHRRDLLFHQAPAAILVGSGPGCATPVEDALLATQNILLAAHAMGLGSCLIGYAVEAMRREPRIKATVGIPHHEPVHSVIALGWPAVSFLRNPGRKNPHIRIAPAG